MINLLTEFIEIVFRFLILPFLVILTTFSAPALSADLTIAWDPNTEIDLKGYGIYFSVGTSGPPYILYGYVSPSDLSNPNNPVFTLTGLGKGKYYITVTAYDNNGNESSYNSALCAQIGDQNTPCQSSGDGSSNQGGGGGGGGGCFIEATNSTNKLFFK